MFVTALAALSVAQARSLSGPPLLDDLSYRAFQYFSNETNASTGLTKDRAGNFAADTYTVASIAATGYSLAAFALAEERGWAPRSWCIARSKVALGFLAYKIPKVHGWFYHFVDQKTGARAWSSEISSIDTAILLCGMIMNVQALQDPTLISEANVILNGVDWNWMLTNGGALPSSLTFSMGWTPENGFITYRWNGYSEELMLYILALGSWSGMPSTSWTNLSRPTVTYDGHTELTGGPLFMHEMSQGFIPFAGRRDSLGYDYGVEERLAVLNDRAYCNDNPNSRTGYSASCWGISASDTPTGYKAQGAPGWGGEDGTLVPTAAIAAMDVTPVESLQAATTFKSLYPNAYGLFGFSNAINPGANWTDTDVIGIDLGMELLGIENWRDDRPQSLMMQSPIIQTGMQRAGLHITNEGPVSQRPLQAAG